MTETAEARTRPTGVRAAVATARAWWAAAALAAKDAHQVYHPPAARTGRTPAHKGLDFEPVRLTTSCDGVGLEGWFVPGTGPHTVVVCHGMGRTRSTVLDHIALLHGAGHHVVAYDMRNHGASGHDRRVTRMADRFTSDLGDMLRSVAADPRTRGGKLAVLAFSFSTWPAVYVLRDGNPQVAAVVCDSGPVFDIPGEFRHFAALRWGALTDKADAPGAGRVHNRLFTLLCTRMLAVRGWPPPLPSVATRMMFVGGARDPVVPAASVMRVAAEYPAAERWVAPQALHMNAVRLDREEYRERVLGFLDKAFEGSGSW